MYAVHSRTVPWCLQLSRKLQVYTLIFHREPRSSIMTQPLQQTSGFFIFSLIIIYSTGSISLYLLIIHIHRFYKHHKSASSAEQDPPSPSSQKQSESISKIINILRLTTIISISVLSIYNLITNTIYISNGPNIPCNRINNAMDIILYYIGKICMYLMFILQSHSVYGQSAFGYKTSKLKILSAIICTTMTILCILTIASTKLILYDFNLSNNEYQSCHAVLPLYYIIIYVLHEIIIIITIGIMYIVPLKKLLNVLQKAQQTIDPMKNGEDPSFGVRFKFTAIKVTILTLTVLISGFIALIISFIIDSQIIIFINSIINILCIMLMTDYYKSWYIKLCCCCIRTCILCCFCNKEQQIAYQNHMDGSFMKNKKRNNDGTATNTDTIDGRIPITPNIESTKHSLVLSACSFF